MLPTREHHGQQVAVLLPCHDIHHRLFLLRRQGIAEPGKQALAGLLALGADEDGGTGIVVDGGQQGIGGGLHHGGQATLQPGPLLLQGQQASADSLKMGMVRSRGPAVWTIVEHRQLRMLHQQCQHLAIKRLYALWLVLPHGQREVHGQDGIRVDEQFEG